MTASDRTEATAPKKWVLWTGRILSGLPVLLMAFSASMKIMRSPEFMEQWVNKVGYPAAAALPIGVVEIACAILYAIPRTSFLGAILVTGYLGGATATHVRLGEPFFMPVLVGVVAWVGLYLRDPRLRTLLVARSSEAQASRPASTAAQSARA